MPSPQRPSPAIDPRHRRVGESEILDFLAVIGWASELAQGHRAEAARGAAKALGIALDAGLGFADGPGGSRLFDPVEVQNFLNWSIASGQDRFWLERFTFTNLAIAAHGRASGEPFEASGTALAPPAKFEVRLSRTFDLTALATDAAVRLRMPLPLRCDYHPRVDVKPDVSPGRDWRPIVSDGRLEARSRVPADGRMTLGANVTLVAMTPSGASGRTVPRDPDLAIHLRASEGLVKATPCLRRLAERLGGSKAPLEAVAAFSDYLMSEFTFRFLRYDEVDSDAPGDWALGQGAFDCQMCAAILVTLCRVHEIPARLVTGHFLYPMAPTNHHWVEIWIDELGWLPFDVLHLDRNRPDAGLATTWWEDLAVRRDYRLATQRLPLAFTGPMSVRFPPAWQMLQAATDGGVAVSFFDVATGHLIYRDEIAVARVG